MQWTTQNCREVEEVMRLIEQAASIEAWLWSYDLLVADEPPDRIPDQFTDEVDKILLERLRKVLAQHV